ncbi:hypothetical protein IMCC3317_40360 [Kordia antarctica]|uniref:Uncharacterized protein n=1 Tax=Kordia antarctica TaxID=1218801 RepID=A0A7L4ZPT6_9FLAO|nr:hypothetical protein [Kordia antarctica]QHI38642.1 hypothetical protein IMCC3317_40360 [Kordia antarctica]
MNKKLLKLKKGNDFINLPYETLIKKRKETKAVIDALYTSKKTIEQYIENTLNRDFIDEELEVNDIESQKNKVLKNYLTHLVATIQCEYFSYKKPTQTQIES